MNRLKNKIESILKLYDLHYEICMYYSNHKESFANCQVVKIFQYTCTGYIDIAKINLKYLYNKNRKNIGLKYYNQNISILVKQAIQDVITCMLDYANEKGIEKLFNSLLS